jgi:hypothetical protein
MGEHLKQYVQYIKNTAHVPLRVDWFDEDWEPIGPMVRKQMVEANLIEIQEGGIVLKDST